MQNLGGIGLIDRTEALYVEVARRLALTNDWVTPYWNGKTFFDYPIWGYWLIALSFKIFGVGEWAARLPTALSAIPSLAIVFWTLRYFGVGRGEGKPQQRQLWVTGWIGAGILALNPAWIAWGRVAVSDMFLSSSLSMAMLAFWWGYAQPDSPRAQHRWYTASFALTAIAVLSKGPVGFLLPLFSIGGFLLYVGKLREVVAEIRPLRSLAIFLAVALPWHAAAAWVNGPTFISSFLGFSNLQRFTRVLYRHQGPWYFYVPCVIVLLLPWSIVLPLAIARIGFWQRQAWRLAPRTRQLGLFACFWLFAVLLFFSAAATKLCGYILPLIPAAAIIAALYWGRTLTDSSVEEKRPFPFLISGAGTALAFLLLAAAAYSSPDLGAGNPAAATWKEELEASRLPLTAAIILGVAGALDLAILLKRRCWRWFWSVNLLGSLVFFALVLPPAVFFVDGQYQQPVRLLSQLIPQVAEPEEEIFVMGLRAYSTVYYSQRQVRFFDDVQDARAHLRDPNRSRNGWPTVLLLTEPKFIDRLALQGRDYQVLASRGGYQLIRVSKAALLETP